MSSLRLAALLAVLAPLATTAGPPGQASQRILTQYDQQAHVPLEPDPAVPNGTRVNVTGLLEELRATHANAFSFLLWSNTGAEYLDFVRVLSLTANASVGGGVFRMWVTLMPPSEALAPTGRCGDDCRCSVPADSPLTPFNETALFNSSLGKGGCLDFVGWAKVLGRLGGLWPHLYAVNIDDFSSNSPTFTRARLAAMRAGLAASAVRLIPTFYYGRTHFILDPHWSEPWLANATDGVLFYFRNERAGQAQCAASTMHSVKKRSELKGGRAGVMVLSALVSPHARPMGGALSTCGGANERTRVGRHSKR